jgi:hypothetical protein
MHLQQEYRMKQGKKFEMEIISIWNMTIEKFDGIYEGTFRIELPCRQYMAVRMTRV